MPVSEARLNANRQNAARSTGPKTVEGKERSRQNSLKHGMTGAGVVLSEADAAEVARRAVAFSDELMAIGEVGQALARRAALHSVRMERGADQQTAALTERIRRIEAEFVPPEGVDDDEADRLRAEAVRIGMFDPSREATLARQYEAAAERGFFRALKHLNQMEKQVDALLKADRNAEVDDTLGSFFEAHKTTDPTEDEFAAIYQELNIPMPRRPLNSTQSTATRLPIDIPMTIGRSR